jgi:hypothetical protein
MALTDTKLRNPKAGDKAYQEADEGGCSWKSCPAAPRSGGCATGSADAAASRRRFPWRIPGYSLADARAWREDCKALVGRGLSPMALKRGDADPNEAKPE